jgi:DNA-binding transcriptional regulator YhcF (GntR family)
MILTRTQQRIIHHIYSQGGEVRGLWPLTDQLNLDYHSAYRRLQEMHAMGIVTVRRVGRCLVISAYQIEPTAETLGCMGVSYSKITDLRTASRERGLA